MCSFAFFFFLLVSQKQNAELRNKPRKKRSVNKTKKRENCMNGFTPKLKNPGLLDSPLVSVPDIPHMYSTILVYRDGIYSIKESRTQLSSTLPSFTLKSSTLPSFTLKSSTLGSGLYDTDCLYTVK